jgi:hypothetical protein
MNQRTITTLIASIFLMTVVQLVAALINVWAAVVCAALLVPAGFAIHRFFEVETDRQWMVAGSPVLSSMFGIAIFYLAETSDPRFWFAPLAAAAVAGIIGLIRNTRSRRCSLCNRRLGSGVAFACPRCGLLVCEQSCWSFDHSRCQLCEQNRVPVFTPDGRWWDKQFGPRSMYGHCQLCMTAADQTDLRNCGKCGRPHCRECWDFLNGQCTRCQWTVEDLPEGLRDFMISTRAEPPGRR